MEEVEDEPAEEAAAVVVVAWVPRAARPAKAPVRTTAPPAIQRRAARTRRSPASRGG